MGFICFLGTALFLAAMLRPFPRGEEHESLSEWIGTVLLIGLAIIIGTDWALACFRAISAGSLWICTAVYAIGGSILLVRRRRISCPSREPLALSLIECLVLGLFCLAIAYVAIRGSLIWVAEYDALTYHFPKAVEIIRAHGIPHIPSGDFRVAYFPWNYELLLADGLLLTPGEGLSHLMALLPAMGFGAYALATFRRAWPEASRLDALVGCLIVCATPIFILQSGDYKNDLLFTFFLLGFFHWMARWCESGRESEFGWAFLSLALCFGTKATALFVLPVGLFLVWRFRARFTFHAWGGLRRSLFLLAGVTVILLLMGACWPLLNSFWCGHLLGDTAMVGGMPGYEANAVPRYIGFSNLWKFPLLAILRPFSSNSSGVWVFWRHEYWWWPSYHPIYGHFGWLCSVLLLLVPFGVFLHRKSTKDGSAAYRIILSTSILAYAFLSMPQRYRVDGMFCGFPRALLCLPLLVTLWTSLPLMSWLRARRQGLLCLALGIGAAGYFSAQSYFYFKNDVTKPFDLVLADLSGTGQRQVNNIEDILDRVAGPYDPVAFDSGFGGMVYRLYGERLTRPVTFLRPSPRGVVIPSEVKWVVIDRAWNVGWSHPGVKDTGQFWLPIQRAPTTEDGALFGQLMKDPGFVLVYISNADDQAVFQRRPAAGP